MKKNLFMWLGCLGILLSMLSCSKDEVESENIEGMWVYQNADCYFQGKSVGTSDTAFEIDATIPWGLDFQSSIAVEVYWDETGGDIWDYTLNGNGLSISSLPFTIDKLNKNTLIIHDAEMDFLQDMDEIGPLEEYASFKGHTIYVNTYEYYYYKVGDKYKKCIQLEDGNTYCDLAKGIFKKVK